MHAGIKVTPVSKRGSRLIVSNIVDVSYRQVSNISSTKSQHLKDSRTVAAVFAEYLEARCWVENEDVVGTAPTGDAPTTSEWSTILLPTKVRLILNVLRYVCLRKLHLYLGCLNSSLPRQVSCQLRLS